MNEYLCLCTLRMITLSTIFSRRVVGRFLVWIMTLDHYNLRLLRTHYLLDLYMKSLLRGPINSSGTLGLIKGQTQSFVSMGHVNVWLVLSYDQGSNRGWPTQNKDTVFGSEAPENGASGAVLEIFGNFSINSGRKMQLNSILGKILDSWKIFRMPLVNRPKNGF